MCGFILAVPNESYSLSFFKMFDRVIIWAKVQELFGVISRDMHTSPTSDCIGTLRRLLLKKMNAPFLELLFLDYVNRSTLIEKIFGLGVCLRIVFLMTLPKQSDHPHSNERVLEAIQFSRNEENRKNNGVS